MTTARTVTSVHGNRYTLGCELGRGGQGAVYAIDGNRLAVKVLRDRSPQAREHLRDQLAMVGRLPLDGLAIARLIEQLRPPHVGYVMELFTGMVPLGTLMRPPKGSDSVVRWYFATGGLRRRLTLLARVAEVFAELHGRGLVYVDPSPYNVFVSEDVEACEVRLIDTDNLRPSTTPGRSLYTPGYGAPEIVQAKGVSSSLSDAHAFAVMAFETLALAHPLLGDAVRNGAPELEERALQGLVPWVDDPHDESNRSSVGIPRTIVLSKNLREDFQETFGAALREPTLRPGMAQWVEHLHRAADRCVVCSACSGTFYVDHRQCPWCDAPRPSFVIAAVLLWDPERLRGSDHGELEPAPGIVREPSGKPRVVDAVVLSAGYPVVLTDRITHGSGLSTARLRIEYARDRLALSALDGGRWLLISSDGRRERTLSDRPVDVAVGDSGVRWLVHAGNRDRLHRVIRFDLRPGGAR